MSKPPLTFREVLRVARESWQHELKTQSLGHIFGQVLKMLYLVPALLSVMLYTRARGLVILGYRIARHYYFRLLIFIEYGPGAYERMRKEYYRDKTY